MHLIAKLETYVHLVPDEALQKALEKVFFLEPWRFSSTEQKKLITSYSGWDKQFLNRLWSRYGSDHVHEFLQMLESMKIKELLPEVLITINAIMEKCGQDPGKFVTLLQYNYITVNRIITLADVYYRDEIRLYDELREAYDGLLTLLAKFNFREAAVLLDEFRIH